MTIPTNYFVTRFHLARAYGPGYVQALVEGQAKIGLPPCPDGHSLTTDKQGRVCIVPSTTVKEAGK